MREALPSNRSMGKVVVAGNQNGGVVLARLTAGADSTGPSATARKGD